MMMKHPGDILPSVRFRSFLSMSMIFLVIYDTLFRSLRSLSDVTMVPSSCSNATYEPNEFLPTALSRVSHATNATYLYPLGLNTTTTTTNTTTTATSWHPNHPVDATDSNNNNNNNNSSMEEKSIRKSMCRPFASASTMNLWLRYIDPILKGTQHPKDPKFILHDFTAHILQFITPRLPLGVKSLPRSLATPNHAMTSTLQQVMERAYVRYRYLQAASHGKHTDGENKEPPPIKIVVLGGSVTYGNNCYSPNLRAHLSDCAWPKRLEILINRFFAPTGPHSVGPMIEVHNLGAGGTNTKVGQALLAYDLLPEKAKHADIIINAYSTNDMHWNTMQEIKEQNVPHIEGVFDMMQGFVRVALESSCHPPLLLWLDDYLGNEQRDVTSLMEPNQVLSVLSSYYGFGVLSYADMMREVVYKDTTEELFSPPGWYKGRQGNMKREIHPGIGMHMTTSFLVEYYMLHLATTFCSLESWIPPPADPITNNSSAASSTEDEIKRRTLTAPGISLKNGQEQVQLQLEPHVPALGLPPPITKDLTLDTMSKQWKEATDARAMRCAGKTSQNVPSNTEPSKRARCPFGWIAGIGDLRKPDQIKNLFFAIFPCRPLRRPIMP